ncbi:hypothetical protein PAXRUDRAFT_827256 [Paxillus rubicundulus Ve08.2h10]|uniref:Unplaced genomic scaffold scaffold_236, whole genome shotgun sequence n=1 Tax=Paxillus rubicundulus Ve08.2h10 TaxID=930991 RepID=A0A0D0E8S8_9AGAM|nr:hypothetical protein PAXRUDRAFT_827256 [Paxillus rubicundulus Ve08.2h10]
MESSTHRLEAERQKQIDLRRQIKKLQAQLTDLPDNAPLLQSPKRKQSASTLLAPGTPSPKKKRRVEQAGGQERKPSAVGGPPRSEHPRANESVRPTGKHIAVLPNVLPHHVKPAPSNVLDKLSAFHARSATRSEANLVIRSSSLAEKPKPKPPPPPPPQAASAPTLIPPEHGHEASIISSSLAAMPQRDDRLALVEELEMGPTDHRPTPDDPLFERLEPNSGIRLSSRSLSHEDLQEYLRGRYYLSPSRLYSCIRLLPDKSGYDVPVQGDWVTIAVVAERGPVKLTRAPVDVAHGDDKQASGDEGGGAGARGSKSNQNHKKQFKKAQSGPPKPHGKKYVNMKLIDFGAHSRSSASCGKATLRGDAFLTLLLFESDGFDKLTEEDGSVRKLYQGGSKGAFEAMSKLKEGDVVALLNPKVLRPHQRNNKAPHPVDNILAVTPESAQSIAIIGRALDLGMCKVAKRDGKPCGSWTDKRVSEVCEWHLTNAVQRQRAGRAEFTAGTSGMTASSTRARKHDYDPSRQWGLKPDPVASGSSVYLVSGHVVGGSSGELFVSEKMGRDAQTKAKRRLEKDADRELKTLLERDKEGMRAVTKAREVAAKMLKESSGGKERKKKVDKGKGKAVNEEEEGRDAEEQEEDGTDTGTVGPAAPGKQAYSASVIKHLGFDPAAKPGQKRTENLAMQKKLGALAALQSSRKNIFLGSRPGPKKRSGVSVPAFMLEHEETVAHHDSSDLDVAPAEDNMVDLDDSDT